MMQIGHERLSFLNLVAHPGIVGCANGSPYRLRLVEGDISVALQATAVRGVIWEDSRSDGAGCNQGSVPVGYGLAHLSDNPLRYPRDVAWRFYLANHCELIAAQPRHNVGSADNTPKARGDCLQENIAGVVAKRVIDLLESVEIDEQEREAPLGGLRPRDCFIERAREAHAARQPGELIALGQPKRTFSRRHQFTRPLLHPLLKVGRKLGELLVQVIQFPRLRLKHRLGFAARAPFAIKAAFETKAALVDALYLSRGAHAARSIVNRTKPPVAASCRVRVTAIGSPK
jgi:hypothetical protein